MTQLELNFDPPTRFELMTPDEMFESMDEDLLRKAVEDRRIERKPATFGPRHAGMYVCMWANTAPYGGILVLGIRNDTAFEGCTKLSQDQLNKLEKAAYDYCPHAVADSKRVRIHRDNDGGEDFVVVFYVEYDKTRVVMTADHKVFRRIADSCIEVKDSSAIRRMQADKGEINFEAEPASLAYPDEYDESAIASFVSTVRERKGWSGDHSIEKILELIHLGHIGRDGFVPNIACLLLFAKDPRKQIAGCRMRFMRFEGEEERSGTKWNNVKDEWIDGTIPEQIQFAETILRSQLRSFSRLGPKAKFVSSPEYPPEAWYEAIVNAAVHRSYVNGMGNMYVVIKMFDDHIDIESPGPFPPVVNPRNIYDVQYSRNPYLMDAMYYLKYVRVANEGVKRMRDTMVQMDLPEPEFRENEQEEVGGAKVRVTLRNKIKHRRAWVDTDVAELIGTQIAATLSEDEKRFLNHAAEYGEITVSDAARIMVRSWQYAKKTLMGLVQRGILDHRVRKHKERDPKARFYLKGMAPKDDAE